MEASSLCAIQSFEKYDPRRKDGATSGSQFFTLEYNLYRVNLKKSISPKPNGQKS